MGCGKSKHDVATGNTITRKKSKAPGSNNHNVVLGECQNDNVPQDITENIVANDTLENERKENESGGTNVEDGRSISRASSNHLTSSMKDDYEATKNFDDDEEGSEKSEYGSPLHEAGGDGMLMSESLEADDHATMETGKTARVKENLDKKRDMVTVVEDKNAAPLN